MLYLNQYLSLIYKIMEKLPFNPIEGEPPRRDSVDEIIRDLSDRRGIKHAWDQIDADIQEEIKQVWREAIQNEKDPEKAVDLILADLTDRRGLRQEWEQIDEDTQTEIRQTWTELISQHT